jgi:hypothetical protein
MYPGENLLRNTKIRAFPTRTMHATYLCCAASALALVTPFATHIYIVGRIGELFKSLASRRNCRQTGCKKPFRDTFSLERTAEGRGTPRYLKLWKRRTVKGEDQVVPIETLRTEPRSTGWGAKSQNEHEADRLHGEGVHPRVRP